MSAKGRTPNGRKTSDNKNKSVKKQIYRIEREQENGSVRIADEVIAGIAGIAATEVEGVARLNGNVTNEIISKIGMNVLSKGIRIAIEENRVKVDVTCELFYGSSIPQVSQEIQDKVKQSVENMTGLEVVAVNVNVAGVVDALKC
jgi:uncharacterized alkaline shock family protein YloU